MKTLSESFSLRLKANLVTYEANVLNSSLKHQIASFWKKDLLLSCLWRPKFGREDIVNGSRIKKKIIKEKRILPFPSPYLLLETGCRGHCGALEAKDKSGLEINPISGLFSWFRGKKQHRENH